MNRSCKFSWIRFITPVNFAIDKNCSENITNFVFKFNSKFANVNIYPAKKTIENHSRSVVDSPERLAILGIMGQNVH